MVFRRLYLGIVLIGIAVPSIAMAGEPSDRRGFKTIDELFAAYKKATEERDWKALFLLGTPERQDADILQLAINAASSKDTTFRNIVGKHGGNWRQFDHAWTEAENQRLMREAPTLAASFGKKIKKKAELFAEAWSYIDKSEPTSVKVRELKDLVRHGATAVGESIETRTCIERQYDAQGNETGRVSRTGSGTSRLWFRQIDGYWFLATGHEVPPAK
jgi:hypothetical protein